MKTKKIKKKPLRKVTRIILLSIRKGFENIGHPIAKRNGII
jgi:hypothetical protein